MSARVIDKLKEKFGAGIEDTHAQCGDETAILAPKQWKNICTWLRNDPAMDFDMLTDLTAVDYPDRERRIEVVVHLYSTTKKHRVRVKARIGDEELTSVEIDSLTSIWECANWLEREAYDMFGVKFRGHPDLRRILMYPEFEGHPLLKSYPAQKTQPLVAYRTEAEAGVPLEKQAPFGPDEGMSFNRKEWTAKAEG